MRNKPSDKTAGPHSKPVSVFLILLTVFTFTQAQSLYEMLAGNSEFLGLRLKSNWQLVEIVLVFNWLPVLALFGVWWALFRVHPSAARVFLALVCFLAFATFFFQLDNAYFLEHWQGVSQSHWLWVLPALALSVALLRFEKHAFTFLLALSPVVVIFPLLFLVRTWAGTETYLPDSVSAQARVSVDTRRELPPIVILVLDELSLPVLLDDEGRIDADRFPHFHALARQSHWFRNATANADHTIRSIPALFTGNLAHPQGGPTFQNYPENLFTWLEPHYRIYSWETWTHFCVARVFHCMGSLHEYTSNRSDLYRDFLTLYGERVLPGGISAGYPSDYRTWALHHDPHRLMPLRLAHFERFLGTLSTLPAEEPVLLFFHHDLPHSPYWLSPEGVQSDEGPPGFNLNMTGDTRILAEILERYRRQIMFVDKNLGQVLAVLKARDLFDRSLILVTSDHGVSYRAEAPGRNLIERGGRVVNADVLLSVPLLIKLPRQQEGAVSDRDVQLLDVLPTLADVLPLELPWPVEGRSAFADPGPARPKLALDRTGQRFEFPNDLGLSALGYRLEPLTTSSQTPAPGRQRVVLLDNEGAKLEIIYGGKPATGFPR